MTKIVVAHLRSADPADRPVVFLGGVPVPARSVLLEERTREPHRLPDDPPSLRLPRTYGPEKDVVLEIRAEPNALDNDATVVVVERPSRPWSAELLPAGGYVCGHGSGRSLTLEEGENGDVTLQIEDVDGMVLLTVHHDEILTLCAELVARSGRALP